jgi:uncharacterized protein YdiU (UPF0061 family)
MRVAESFLRFGHFQYYAHTNQFEELKNLITFVIDNYFTNFKGHPNSYILFFQEIVKRTAKLFARWQAVGFCHGVLNTDNLSILGLTLDYGPFGFIENFDQDFVCNHSDHEGRYSLGNQPGIGMWNLKMLGEALATLINEEDRDRTLNSYPQIFSVEYSRLLLEKCGLYKNFKSDDEFLRGMLNMLVDSKLDYTQFFRDLSSYSSGLPLKNVVIGPSLKLWLEQYETRLGVEETDESERHQKMLAINPKFILRNYIAQIAIDDPSQISEIFKVLTNPFEEWTEYNEWSGPAPAKYKNLSVSCSS